MTASPTAAVAVVPLPPAGTRAVAPIEFIYGSGAGTDEVYFTRRGAELFELPVVWLAQQDCWGASLLNPHGTGDRSRPLSPQCVECHTVWVDYQRGSLNEYGPFEPQLVGVTCERCHGPAEKHVAHHRTHLSKATGSSGATQAAADKDSSIVRPGQLSRERLMDLCAQCHTNTVRHRRPPFSYRPGEPLGDSFHVLEMKHPEQNRVANQVQSLKASRCYQQSETLTCITCHDPHHVPERADAGASNRSCKACHQPDACGAHARLPAAVREQCAMCHMPKRNKVQVNFETAAGDIVFPAPRYEHRIAVYPEAEREVLHQWHGRQSEADSMARTWQLAGELHTHWRQVGDAAKDEQRWIVAIDAYRSALRFGDVEGVRTALGEVTQHHRQSNRLWFEGNHQKQTRRLTEAIATFESILAIEPNSARTHYELGTLYAAVNRRPPALEHLKAARELDLNDPGAEVMLGWLSFLDNKPELALSHYLAAQKIEPWSERIERMIGQCQMKLGRWEESALAMERALTINPRFSEVAGEMRTLLRERLPPAAALPHAVAAVKATAGQDTGLLLTLAEIYRDLDRLPEARRALAVAQKLAEEKNSDLRPQLESLETLIRETPIK